MTVIDQIRIALSRIARHVFVQAAGAAIVGYFAYHAIHGDRGVVALTRLQGEIGQAHQVLDEVRAERERIERRASLLRPENLDRDMLDERARTMLNFTHPDEIVILRPRDSQVLPAPQPLSR